jgi:hypothetical protein
LRAQQENAQGDLADGVGGATQTGIVGAHHGGNAIQHAFLKLVAIDEMLADLLNAASDGEIVVAGGDDEIGPDDSTFFVDLVVVDQEAAGRFNYTHALEGVHSAGGADVGIEDFRVIEERFDTLERINDFHEARVVKQEGTVRG